MCRWPSVHITWSQLHSPCSSFCTITRSTSFKPSVAFGHQPFLIAYLLPCSSTKGALLYGTTAPLSPEALPSISNPTTPSPNRGVRRSGSGLSPRQSTSNSPRTNPPSPYLQQQQRPASSFAGLPPRPSTSGNPVGSGSNFGYSYNPLKRPSTAKSLQSWASGL